MRIRVVVGVERRPMAPGDVLANLTRSTQEDLECRRMLISPCSSAATASPRVAYLTCTLGRTRAFAEGRCSLERNSDQWTKAQKAAHESVAFRALGGPKNADRSGTEICSSL